MAEMLRRANLSGFALTCRDVTSLAILAALGFDESTRLKHPAAEPRLLVRHAIGQAMLVGLLRAQEREQASYFA
jgi:hypothetical protein